MSVIVDNRVQEVRTPGIFYMCHGPVVIEDVLLRPREIFAIFHVDDKEPMAGCPPCERLQLGQHLHGKLFQVLKCCSVPVGGIPGELRTGEGAGSLGVGGDIELSTGAVVWTKQESPTL